jgi:serine/threonine protein kinase
MGVVYLGRQISVDRKVAVKVISRTYSAFSSAVGRFMEEARTASGLHHPNVVTVHDFGRTSDGLLYLVMEYLDGITLSRLLDQGPLDIERILEIATQICSGLVAAHSRGIVHRDLKPDNIMLCEIEGFGPMAKLLDFGIAKSILQDSGLTTDGFVLGTPTYMSPEQSSGRPVGFSSDLYSLGVIMYEMACAHPPFEDEDPHAVLQAHCAAEPPPLLGRTVIPIPEGLERLILQCLRKRPEDRPGSAVEIRTSLMDLMQSPRRGSMPRVVPDIRAVPPVDSPGGVTEPWKPWRQGHIIADHYRIESIFRVEPSMLALAVDVQTAEGTKVLLRTVPLARDRQADSLELIIERHLSLLTRFRHERIVALREVVRENGSLVLVSAVPVGEPLELVLNRTGRLEHTEAVRIVLDLLVAIEALHNLGVVHQDIRPGTIRQNGDGTLALDGIGLWPLADAQLAILLPEEDIEARQYKAPEQIGLIGEPVGPEADLYAVGALLFRMLTDQPAFEAHQETELIHRKMTAVIPPPSMFAPNTPAALDAIVDRLLRPRAIDRFRSVAALRLALERVLSGTADGNVPDEVFQHLGSEGRLQGRDTERLRLASLADRLIQEGLGSVAILRGPSGVGKTRLVDEISHDMRRKGGMVVRAKAREADASSSLGAWKEVLGSLGIALRNLDPRSHDAAVRRILTSVGNQGALLRPFAPWLSRIFAGLPQPPVLDAEAGRERLLSAMCQVPLAVATRESPLCLVLDDLQWMDSSTLHLLERLAAAADRHPILILGCTRPTPVDALHLPNLEGMKAAGVEWIEIGGLEPSAVRSFLAERMGNVSGLTSLTNTMVRLTDGYPAGLRALLQDAEAVGAVRWTGRSWNVVESRLDELLPAQNVVARVRNRLAGLGFHTLDILQAASVWGAKFDIRILSAMRPDIEHGVIVSALVEADRAEILRSVRRDEPGMRDFAHDSLRDAFLGEIPIAKRQALHRQAAEILADSSMGMEGRELRLAEHLVNSDPRAEDVPILESSARLALEGFAADGAIMMGKAALARLAGSPAADSVVIRLKLLVATGLILARRPDEATSLLQEILAGKPPPEVLAMAYKELGDCQFHMGRLAECLSSLARAAQALGYKRPGLPALAKGRSLQRMMREIWFETRKPRDYESTSAIDRNRSLLADVLNHEARARFFVDGADASMSLLDALHHARKSGDLRAYVRIMSQTGGQLASSRGWVVLSRRMLDAAVRAADASGDNYSVALARATRLMIYGAMGEFDRLDQERPEIEAMISRVGEAWASALFASYLFDVAQERGRPSEGLPVVMAFADSLVSARHRDFSWAWAHNRGAWVALAIGRPDLARAIVDQALGMEFIRKDRVLLGYIGAWDVQAALDGREPERAIRAAESYVRYLASGPTAHRHNGISTYIATRAAVAAALEVGVSRESICLVEELLRRGTPLTRPFPIYRAHMTLCEARLDLLKGRRRRAQGKVNHLVREARGFPLGTVVTAEALLFAADLAGGNASLTGRNLLREAFERLQTCDDCLPLKRSLASSLGQHPGGDAHSERISSALAGALRIPLSSHQSGSSVVPVGIRGGLSQGGLELFEWTHASIAALSRGDAPLEAVLNPVVRFAGVDLCILFRYDWISQQVTPIAVSPPLSRGIEDHCKRALPLCRQAAESMTPIIEDARRSTDGLLKGSSAAFPVSRSGTPDLILYMSNRNTPGVIDSVKSRHIEALLHALEVAVRIADRTTGR